MYSSAHSAVATIIMVSPLPIELRITLAIFSHAIVDMLGEGYPGDDWNVKEIILHAVLLLIGIFTRQLPIVIAGILLGNLLDMLDMRRKNGVWAKTGFIHDLKFYPPVMIQLSGKMTNIINFASCLLAVLILR